VVKTINLTKPPDEVNPYDILYDPENGIVYMSSVTPNLPRIQAASMSLLTPAGTGTPSVGLALDSANGYLYITGAFNENVTTVLNTATNRVVTSIPTFIRPWGITYDSGNQLLYTANLLSNNVSVINASSDTIMASVPVGTNPIHIAYNSVNGDIYVTNSGSGNISVIGGSTNKVVATIPVTNGQAIGVAVDNVTGEVYVSSNCPNGATVINGSSNRATGFIPTDQPYFGTGCQGAQGDDTSAVAVDAPFHLLYVTDAPAGTVSIINETNQSLASVVKVGEYPVPMALDPTDSLLFVAKYGTSNLTVLGPPLTSSPGSQASAGDYLGLSASAWFTIWTVTLVAAVVAISLLWLHRGPRKRVPPTPPR
jgi:YVTN family beta-propeller protein